ncbi:hypothetical protein EJD97_000721 [Solanum chilense]|uniref:Uncharacterized protein n=1 Tax=Solanum chilense TaxID=4083 RepID=A0A6N2ANA1_SOLCI|nr:hypothetical protein EJD97_000721 [Solanum chilense]
MLQFHHCLSLHTNPLNNPSIFFFLTHPTTSVSTRWNLFNNNRRGRRKICWVEAVEKDSEFEIDPDKAREALRKLDEQLQTLSQKQIDPPKIRATDVTRASSQVTEDTRDPEGSFLTSLAFGLLLFTIFYNILFTTVIKPAVDGPETIAEIDLYASNS